MNLSNEQYKEYTKQKAEKLIEKEDLSPDW